MVGAEFYHCILILSDKLRDFSLSLYLFFLALLLLLSLLAVGCDFGGGDGTTAATTTVTTTTVTTTVTTAVTTAPPTPGHAVSVTEVPPYAGSPYAIINNNVPGFTEDELTTESYEFFSPLDSLGRCGVTLACIGRDLMPTEERGSIGMVKPSGWQTVKYDTVSGKYLYNRCHLIGFQLTGENANERNLITGTRYMNVDGMLPFEDMVADYVKETGNHVMYRVTPIFVGNELVARGVQIEALSVEDGGDEIDGIMFNVFVYNVQPGITIDYATGASRLEGEAPPTAPPAPEEDEGAVYILNTNTDKFHREDCRYATSIQETNRVEFIGDRQDLIDDGYSPCGTCKP